MRPLKTEAAYITVGGKPNRIAIDNVQTGLIPGVVHELLHLVLRPSVADFNPTLEEDLVIILTTRIEKRILDSIEETEWWRAAIDRKLASEG